MPTWSNGYDISLSLEGNQERGMKRMALFKQNGYNPGSIPGVGVQYLC